VICALVASVKREQLQSRPKHDLPRLTLIERRLAPLTTDLSVWWSTPTLLTVSLLIFGNVLTD